MNKSFTDKDPRKKELDTLEIACRLNYTNVKAKENDYDLVRTHAIEVLKIDPENGKGLFRLG